MGLSKIEVPAGATFTKTYPIDYVGGSVMMLITSAYSGITCTVTGNPSSTTYLSSSSLPNGFILNGSDTSITFTLNGQNVASEITISTQPLNQTPGGGGGGGSNPNPPPDPAATGAPPPIPYPNSYYAQKLPANTPAWWNKGNMPSANSTLLVNNFISQYTAQFGAVYANDVCPRYVVNVRNSINGFTPATWTFNPGGRWNSSPQGTYTVNIPQPITGLSSGFRIGANTDHEVVLIDYDNLVTFQFWGTSNASNTVPTMPPSSNTGQIINFADANYVGFGPSNVSGLSTSTTACGLPYTATLITWADYLSGAINHMISCAVGNPEGSPVDPAPMSDAVSAESLANGGIYQGTIFIMPKSVGMPNFAAAGSNGVALAQMVFTALQNYGMVVMDSTAGNGVAVAIEAFQPWQDYNPSAYPSMKPPYWMWDNTQSPFGEGAFKGMPWNQMVAIEASSLLCPVMSDNNPASPLALQETNGFAVTTGTSSLTLRASTATNDMLLITGMVNGGTLGNTISGLGGTWVKVYEHALTYAGDGSQRVSFVYIGYACASGNTSISTTFTGSGDVSLSRFARSSATNPIVTSTNFNDNTSGVKNSFNTTAITATAVGQIIFGCCFVGYIDLTERSLPTTAQLNYNPTTWSDGTTNRHIINGTNLTNSVFQNMMIVGSTGSKSATMHANGYTGFGGYETELILINP